MGDKPSIGSPAWLRGIPARWGLSQAETCRVLGIAPSTFRAKCAGRIAISDRLGRNAILIELNPEYAEMARRRIERDAGLFASVA